MNELLLESIQMIKNKKYEEYIQKMGTNFIINGILHANGWNVLNLREVQPQFSKSGKSQNLILKLFDNNKIFIKVKKYQEKLNEKGPDQIKDYLKDFLDIEYFILTNGCSWGVYNSKGEREADIDLIKDSASNIEIFFDLYLSRERMADEWFNTNMTTIYSKNAPQAQKEAAIHKLRKMEDERVYETFVDILSNPREEVFIRLNALNGIAELKGIIDIKPVLEMAVNDPDEKIRNSAKIKLKELTAEFERKINIIKSERTLF